MTTAYLGLGSNTDPRHHLRLGLRDLATALGHLERSPIYRSAAVGFDGADFVNLVVAVETDREPLDLRDCLRRIEDRHGRIREAPKFSDRTLDIDLLLYGGRVMNVSGLVLPRPDVLRFAHVLRPLAELAPDRVCPGTDQTLGELWAKAAFRHTPLAPLDPGYPEA